MTTAYLAQVVGLQSGNCIVANIFAIIFFSLLVECTVVGMHIPTKLVRTVYFDKSCRGHGI